MPPPCSRISPLPTALIADLDPAPESDPVADLRALIKARAADDPIGQAKRDETLLEGSGLKAGPDQNRNFFQWRLAALQGLDAPVDFFVTLNDGEGVDPARVLDRLTYHHPLFTPAGIAAQERHDEIDGVRGVHFAGAYWGYGFHEDGVNSALRVLERLEADPRSRAERGRDEAAA